MQTWCMERANTRSRMAIVTRATSWVARSMAGESSATMYCIAQARAFGLKLLAFSSALMYMVASRHGIHSPWMPHVYIHIP
jgi:hypothetical protein